MLDTALASRFARTALGHVTREYPNKLDHVMAGPDDARTPRKIHPAFYGSFDWHSCVHSWWMLLTLRRLVAGLPEADAVAALADETFIEANMQAELAYAERPQSRGFERPYGWAWLLFLHGEATRHPDRDWAANIEPLARHFAEGWRDYLGVLEHPIRSGAHANTAFAMLLSLDWAEAHDSALADLLRTRGIDYFAADGDPGPREPSGDDFLCSELLAAQLVGRIDKVPFDEWLHGYWGTTKLADRWQPVQVTDPTDGKMAHLDGLNLSRAWSMREIERMAARYGLHLSLSADEHLAASLDAVDGDYMGSHWLASFALLALLSGDS
ncbi:MAG: DUF2891 domain-containing protein [Alteraurantiacibacter sp.]